MIFFKTSRQSHISVNDLEVVAKQLAPLLTR